MTLYDALSLHGYQVTPSVTGSEAEAATQRLDSGNIELVIVNMNMTPALRPKRGMPWLSAGEP
jgi:hypothetical protein